MRFAAFAALAIMAGCVDESGQPLAGPTTGRGDYVQFCAECHGPMGKGDGSRSATLDIPAMDLTSIAARNGGTFPKRKVMAVIYGNSPEHPKGTTMPGYGLLLEGRTVNYDSGDGIETPTPWRLVALTEYLERLQE